MLQLFYDYCSKGKTKQALLVGQNIFNKDRANRQIFEAYFDYLILLSKEREVEEAKTLIQQAAGTLAVFSENVEMCESIAEFILTKEEMLNNALQLVSDKENAVMRERINIEIAHNDDALSLLDRLLDKISKCEDENKFNVYINDLGRIDKSINIEQLNSTQESRYSELTKKSSEIVSMKMVNFEKVKNREYNIKAIESYEKIFSMFKNGKVIGEHKDVLNGLFKYDASRLYNETLVYYNHVYNYVLGKLSDDEKFLMTKYAIMCEG